MDNQTCSECETEFDLDKSGLVGPDGIVVCGDICAEKAARNRGTVAVIHQAGEHPEITREQGIAMIRHLQQFGGPEESEEESGAGWDAMTVQDKIITQNAYKATGGPDL